jgi:hypothetical protein
MKQLLYSIDFLGPTPRFVHQGYSSYKSAIGVILSIITIVLLCAASGYFVSLLMGKRTYNVLTNDEFDKMPMIDWTKPQMAIQLYDKTLLPIPNFQKYYGIVVNYWWNKPSFDTNGNVTSYTVTPYPMNVETCDIGKHFEGHEDLWRKENLFGDPFCVKNENPIPVRGLFGENNFTGFVFWIHKCINSTENGNMCASPEDITKVTTNCYIKFSFLDAYVDNTLIGNPVIQYIKSEILQSSSTVYKRAWYLFKNVEYQDDAGFIFPDSTLYQFSNYERTIDATDLRTNPTIPGAFHVISINNHNWRKKIYRSYYKLQNMIADLGGITKGLIMIATFINTFITQTMYYESIIINAAHNFEASPNHTIVKESNKNVSQLSQIDLRHNLSKSNITLYRKPIQPIDGSTNKTYLKRKPQTDYKLSVTDYLMPKVCYGKANAKLNYFLLMKGKVKALMDINTYIEKLSTVDKLLFVSAGTKYKNMILASPNPFEVGCESVKNDFDLRGYDKFVKTNFNYFVGEKSI